MEIWSYEKEVCEKIYGIVIEKINRARSVEADSFWTVLFESLKKRSDNNYLYCLGEMYFQINNCSKFFSKRLLKSAYKIWDENMSVSMKERAKTEYMNRSIIILK